MSDELSAAEKDFELVVGGFQGTPEEIERQWFEQVYKGRGDSMAQLTWRAVLMGSLLGGVLSLTNLYIGLKAGWGLGVAITACILSYAIWTGLYRLGLVKTPMTILENNCMQSTASSAGYSTGGTLVSAFAAYVMLNGQPLPIPLTLAWVFFLAVLGVTMAIPMKRQMINIEQLRFPSGIAAAETLRALHSQGERASGRPGFGRAAVLAALNKFWADGLKLISSRLDPFSSSALVATVQRNGARKKLDGADRAVELGSRFFAAGALTGLRVSASMMLGGMLCWAVFVPILQHRRDHRIGLSRRRPVALWGGVACMVTSGLLSFLLQWRSILSSFRNVRTLFSGSEDKPRSEVDALEAPMSWFIAGQLVSLAALAWLAQASFGMPVWQSAWPCCSRFSSPW